MSLPFGQHGDLLLDSELLEFGLQEKGYVSILTTPVSHIALGVSIPGTPVPDGSCPGRPLTGV